MEKLLKFLVGLLLFTISFSIPVIGIVAPIAGWHPEEHELEELLPKIEEYFVGPSRTISLEVEQQAQILGATLFLSAGWLIHWILYRWTTRRLNRKGEYIVIKPRKNLPMRPEEVERAIEEVLKEAGASLEVPELRPRYLREALKEAQEASLREHAKAAFKARLLARIQQGFSKASVETLKHQAELVRSKGKLLEESHKLAFKIQDLNQQRELSQLDHELAAKERELKLAKLHKELEELSKDEAEAVEAEILDPEEELRREIEQEIGQRIDREIFTQGLKAEKLEELLRERRKRLEKIEQADLPEEDKEQLRQEVLKNFRYSVNRIISGI
jgi:hypothetical protein